MTKHKQVKVLDFECDEDLAELLELVNRLGARTMWSCQDHCGLDPREVLVVFHGSMQMSRFLNMVADPAEEDDPHSLTRRAVLTHHGWDDERWHYQVTPYLRGGSGGYVDGSDEMRVMFPFSDLDEVVARLRKVAGPRATAITYSNGEGN
jgi:hypothetical protein